MPFAQFTMAATSDAVEIAGLGGAVVAGVAAGAAGVRVDGDVTVAVDTPVLLMKAQRG